MRTPERFPPSAGFSLVEFLVAMALTLVLSIVTLSLGQHLIFKGREARCLGQLRQIGALFSGYLADHLYRYPLAAYEETPGSTSKRFWPQDLVRHSGHKAHLGLFVCPGVKDIPDSLRRRAGGFAYVSYGINRYGVAPLESDTPWLHPAHQLAIEEPSKLLLLVDYEERGQPYDGWYSSSYSGMAKQSVRNAIKERHQSLNALFCDGSVRMVHESEVAAASSTTAYPWGTYRFTLYR